MNDDRGPGAMPKLYGAPAYARPPVLPVNPIERPFDPDDLPLEAERGEDDQEPALLQARPYESVAVADAPAEDHDPSTRLAGRALRFRLPGRG